MTARLAILLSLIAGPALAGQRVVSLDYCADQYVMALAEPEEIAAVSPAAGSEYSYLAHQSVGLPRMRPTGEQVLLAAPGLVVRQWGGGYNTTGYLDRFGIPVVQISFGLDIESTRTNLRAVAAAMGAEPRAEELIRDMDARLAAVTASRRPGDARLRALYVTPGGITAGSDTFIHALLTAAGVVNMGAEGGRAGWHEIDLEALALGPPDLIVGAFFDLRSNHVNYWSIARHSFLKQAMRETPTVLIPGAEVACGAWFFVDAVEAIHAAAEKLTRQRLARRE